MAQRYKRKKNKRSKKNRSARIVLSILFLCLVSALVGFYGVKFILSLSDKPESAETEELSAEAEAALDDGQKEEDAVVLEKTGEEYDEGESMAPAEENIDDGSKQNNAESIQAGINLYAYQLGGFSNRDNAEKFLLELQAKGECGIIFEGDNFKVLNIVYGDSGQGEYFKESAKSIAGDAFLYKIEKKVEFQYDADKHEKAVECARDYERAISMIGEVQSDYVEYLNSNLAREDLKQTISAKLIEMERIALRLESLDSDAVSFESLALWYEGVETVFRSMAETENKRCMDDLSELYLDGIGIA